MGIRNATCGMRDVRRGIKDENVIDIDLNLVRKKEITIRT